MTDYHNSRTELEQLVLSCMFDGTGYQYASELISPEMLSITEHRDVFKALQRLHERGQTRNGDVDPVCVHDELRDGKAGRVSLETLVAIGSQKFVASSAEYHVSRLIDVVNADRLRVIGNYLTTLEKCDIQTLDSVIEQVETIRSNRPVAAFSTMDQVIAKRTDRLKGGIVKFKTGVGPLDRTLGGLRPGSVTIIAGRPGAGKSVLLAQIGLNFAKQNRPVSLVSLEMEDIEFADRLLQTVEEQRLAGLPIHVADAVFDWPSIAAACRLSVKRWKCQLLVMDYLQLIEGTKNKYGSREQEVASVSRGLKRLAKELDVPVICGAQLNRNAVKNAKPTLADLRESGSIEQDADNVILLYRDDEEDMTNVEIAKQRGGKTELHKMKLVGSKYCFEEVDEYEQFDRT